MYCRYCGKQITSIATVCPYCHKKVNDNVAPTQTNYYYAPMNDTPDINQTVNTVTNKIGNVLASIAVIFGIFLFVKGIGGIYDWSRNYYNPGASNNKPTTYTSTYALPSVTSKPQSTYMPIVSSKNYQQIYDEYSKKLINAGPTSSITEMAQICNEGVQEMASYMFTASGTDGQYATYESWAGKLYDVYIKNVR